MKKNNSRRDFLKVAGLGISAGMLNGFSMPAIRKNLLNSTEERNQKLQLGLCSYTFRNFSLEQLIEFTKRLEMKKLSLKEMHLPLKSSKEEIAKATAQIKQAGIELYAVGVIYMTSVAEVNQAFEYAKDAGAKIIVGVPEHEFLPLAEKKVKEYNINLAIHNHGPTDKRYPSPESVYEKIKNMDSRVGMCLDIGHTMRLGIDPSESAEKYFDRLMDVHIKDESKPNAEGNTIEIGRGVIDIPKFLKTLIRMKYKGIVSFEFEKDKEDPLPGLAESVGYIRGILSVI